MTEDSSITLQTVIDEFKNISPELSKAFIFKKGGEIVASLGGSVAEDQAKKIASSFEEIVKQSEVMGGVENLTIQGVSCQLEVASTNNRYLATVASRAADEKMVKALAYVIVPTVIKLLDQIDLNAGESKPTEKETLPTKEIEQLPAKETEKQSAEETEATALPHEAPIKIESLPKISVVSSEKVIPKPPSNQFMVERIGGLLVAPDTVRVDPELIAKWRDLYGDREIMQINVKTLEGKSILCRFKPKRETERYVKGTIQIPERILQILGTGDGKLVIVKPWVNT